MFTQILDNNFNDTIKKHIIAFGSLFSSVYTKTTRNESTEKKRVAISYGPKEKFIQLILEESGISDKTHVQMDLPRMGFELTNLQYDPVRRLNKLKQLKKVISPTKTIVAYSESPYTFTFALYVFTRHSEHTLQIIEQIVPYFTPDFTVTINMNELYTKVDVPIVLANVDINEDYEGAFDSRRGIISALSFNMKGYIYSTIKQDTSIPIASSMVNFSDFGFTIGYTGDVNNTTFNFDEY